MDDYGWPTFWAVIVIAVLCAISYWVHNATLSGIDEREQIAQLIASGKSPIQARCAVKGIYAEKEELLCQAAILAEKH